MKNTQTLTSHNVFLGKPLAMQSGKRQALLVITAIMLVVFSNASLAQEPPDRNPSIQPLRVLYAGELGHPRTAEFVGFLESRFAEVACIAFADLSKKTAANSDVVVIDIPGSDMETYRRIALPENFDRSTILVGVNGARLGEKEAIKLNDA